MLGSDGRCRCMRGDHRAKRQCADQQGGGEKALKHQGFKVHGRSPQDKEWNLRGIDGKWRARV